MAVFTAAEALRMAMEIETNGEVFYNQVAADSNDSAVKALFEDLAAQERGHYRAFEKMLQGVRDQPGLPSTEFDEYQSYAQVALSNALFAGPDKALALAKQAADHQAALQAAIGFEKDTLLFFYDLRDVVSETDRETVSDVIREEKKHLRRLARML